MFRAFYTTLLSLLFSRSNRNFRRVGQKYCASTSKLRHVVRRACVYWFSSHRLRRPVEKKKNTRDDLFLIIYYYYMTDTRVSSFDAHPDRRRVALKYTFYRNRQCRRGVGSSSREASAASPTSALDRHGHGPYSIYIQRVIFVVFN